MMFRGKLCFTALTLALLSFGLVACNDEQIENEVKKIVTAKLDPELDPKVKAMVLRDLLALKDLKVEDKNVVPWFKEIFGGNTGLHVLGFLNERIQHFMQDKPEMTRMALEYEDWGSDPELEARAKELGAETGAYNAGAALWYMAIINKIPLYWRIGNEKLEIKSTRSGIMGFGPGYKARELWVIPIPASIRQSILVHEARHSDCTGGVKESELAVARTSTSLKDFMANYKKPECAHLHAYCPKDHNLEGLPACDGHAWGSYAIGAVYLQQVQHHLEATKGGWWEKTIAQAMALDSFSRVLLDYEAMLVGKFGKPDMTSGQYIAGQ